MPVRSAHGTMEEHLFCKKIRLEKRECMMEDTTNTALTEKRGLEDYSVKEVNFDD